MRQYFLLQYKLINRHLSDFGLHPFIGYVLLAMVFLGLSVYLFYAVEFASYLYALMAISLTSMTGEANRTGFLKLYFSKGDFLKIRLWENVLLVLPFVAFLCCKHEFSIAAGVFVLSAVVSLLQFENRFNATLPTPFYRYPFEFATSFRKNFIFVFFALFLLVMAVLYDNPNLGIFSMIVVLFSALSCYINPEPAFYVWIFSMTPRAFIGYKIKVALGYSLLICLPFLLVIAFFFFQQLAFALAVLGLGLLYIIAALLGKYAFFPSTMDLVQGIVLAISFSFPPLLLFIIPYFYSRSVKQLKPVFE